MANVVSMSPTGNDSGLHSIGLERSHHDRPGVVGTSRRNAYAGGCRPVDYSTQRLNFPLPAVVATGRPNAYAIGESRVSLPFGESVQVCSRHTRYELTFKTPIK